MRSMINEAKVTKRYNTGDYEYEEYMLGAVVDEKESGADVLSELKAQINAAFVGTPVATKETKAEKKTAKPAEKKEEKKNAKSKSKASSTDDEDADDETTDEDDSSDASESDSNDEAADSEDSDANDDSADDSEDDSDSEEDTKASKGKSAKANKAEEGKSGKKKFVKKPQGYNRGIEQHKEIFSGVLRSVSPDWKKSDKTKVLAKKASEEMEGENFLDENGEVYANFKALVARLMKGKSKA